MCLEDRDRGGSHQVSRGPESGEDGSAREVPRAPDPTLMTGCPTVLHSNLPKNTDARPCWVPPAGSTFIGFRLLRGCMMCASLFLTPSCQFSDSSLSLGECIFCPTLAPGGSLTEAAWFPGKWPCSAPGHLWVLNGAVQGDRRTWQSWRNYPPIISY